MSVMVDPVRKNLIAVLRLAEFFTVTDMNIPSVVGVRLGSGWSVRGAGFPADEMPVELAADRILTCPAGTVSCMDQSGFVLLSIDLTKLLPIDPELWDAQQGQGLGE